MTEEFKQYEKSIKKKHSFSWNPKYEEEMKTSLNKTVFFPIAIQTFEKLGWEFIFQDENSVEAKVKLSLTSWGEKITISWNHGRVMVKSVSLGNEIWDNGRNSKRVKLFIYAFQQTEKEFDREDLIELEKETEKANNWDNYVIPDSLPQPKERKKPEILIPIIGGIITGLLLGFILAFLSMEGLYFIGVFEFLVALAIGFALKYLIKLGNYTNYKKLNYILMGIILITYVSNQYFQYQMVLAENNNLSMSFIEFIKLRLEMGLTINESINTGWIGLIISWALQLGLTYIIGTLRLTSVVTAYQLERVPQEVSDFAFYHFVKKKTEKQVRTELSKMGWKEKQDQDDVFESIGAIQNAIEIQRME